MSWEFLEGLPGNSEIIFTRVLNSKLILDQPAFVTTKPDENIEPSVISNQQLDYYVGIESIEWVEGWNHRTMGPV